MPEYLNIWVEGKPLVSIEIKSDKQRIVYDKLRSGKYGKDIFLARQDCPQTPIDRIKV